MLDRKYHTPEELSKRFRLSLSTIYNLIEKGELPCIKLGRCYLIPDNDLVVYLQKQSISKKKLKDISVPKAAKEFIRLVKDSSIKGNIVNIIIYGSYVRGDYNSDSDIDLLVILDRSSNDLNDAIAKLSDEAMASTDYDDFLSIIQISNDQWKRAAKLKTPFYNAVKEGGVALWKT